MTGKGESTFKGLLNLFKKHWVTVVLTVIITGLVAFCGSFFYYLSKQNKANYTMAIELNYYRATYGLTPDGKAFDMYTIISEANVKEALTEIGVVDNLEEKTKGVMNNLVIAPVTLQSYLSKVTYVGGAKFNPTRYTVELKYDGELGLSDTECKELLTNIFQQFRNNFCQQYRPSTKIDFNLKSDCVTACDEYVDLAVNMLNEYDELDSALLALNTFDANLYNEHRAEVVTLRTKLDAAFDYIVANNVVKDSATLMADKLNAYKTSYKALLEKYNSDAAVIKTAIDGYHFATTTVTVDKTVKTYTESTSVYQAMVEQYVELGKQANACRYKISLLDEQMKAVTSDKYTEEEAENAKSKFTSLYNDSVATYNTIKTDLDASYSLNVANNGVQIVVPPVRESSNSKKLVPAITVSLMLAAFLIVMRISAFVDDRKAKKTLKAGQGDSIDGGAKEVIEVNDLADAPKDKDAE